MHPLLERQLKRFLGGPNAVPSGWAGFIAAVDAAYEHADGDRRLLERSLELTSQELTHRNDDLRRQATTDGLTGLPNHRAFQERIREEASLAASGGLSLALIMLDIDGFKRINDAHGHLAGDQILREVAAALVAHLGESGHPHRYGGDEFGVLLPGEGRRQALKTAESLRRALADRVRIEGHTITASLGASYYPEGAGSAEELLYGADAAMYWAKSAGKDRVGDWGRLLRGRADDSLPWYVSDRGVRAPDAVAALVAALTAKDPSTSAHTDRCSWYSGHLAEALGLNEDEISTVRLASLLHDVGKIGVPDEVLFKAGPLNEDEWAVMKQHPAAALHVLREIRTIHEATPAILHHHEHYDGSGYPHGLKGGDIPIASRILLVTDAFDAMTSDRPYRKAMPAEAAIEELKRHSGSQFDPAVVEAFLRVLDEHGRHPPAVGITASVVSGGGAVPAGRRRR